MLNAYPPAISPTASALITFVGPANTALTWNVSGAGILSGASTVSDAQGVAVAKFTPSAPDQLVTVSVVYETVA